MDIHWAIRLWHNILSHCRYIECLLHFNKSFGALYSLVCVISGVFIEFVNNKLKFIEIKQNIVYISICNISMWSEYSKRGKIAVIIPGMIIEALVN